MNLILEKQIPMQPYFSAEASNLLENLLKKKPEDRIGCRKSGVAELKAHPWFKNIDWDNLEHKLVKPPFVPETENFADVQYIDDEFLQDNIAETPAVDCELTKMHNKDGVFSNFDYISEENMGTLSQIEPGEYGQSTIEKSQGGQATRYKTLLGPASKS